MSERIGIRAASRLAGTKHPVNLYSAVARQQLKADVVDGELRFDPRDVEVWRDNVLDAERKRLNESVRQRDAVFRKVNAR